MENTIDKMSRAEQVILDAQYEVEKLPADIRLTSAAVLIQKARSIVSNFIYSEKNKQDNTHNPPDTNRGINAKSASEALNDEYDANLLLSVSGPLLSFLEWLTT